MEKELCKFPNIGVKLQQQLNEVGINTYDELKELGAEKAWLKIQGIDETACIHRLLALEGALQGIRKSFLPEERKEELRKFYYEHKKVK